MARADEAPVSLVRADRMVGTGYDLAAPRQLDSGAWVYEAVVSTPGVLQYPTLGLVDYVDAAALSERAYLDALVGLPVIDDSGLHWPGVTVEQIAAARVGTIIAARWDDAQQATIVTIVIDVPRGIEAIRALGVDGLSLRYEPDMAPLSVAPDGTQVTGQQVRRRRLNHVLLTPRPNDANARIRADDQGAAMTPEQIAEMVAQLRAAMQAEANDAAVIAANTRADEAATALATANERIATLESEAAARADSAPTIPTWGDWLPVLTVAHKRGVKIDPQADIDAARKAIVVAAMPGRADSATTQQIADMVAALAVDAGRPDMWDALKSQRADQRVTTASPHVSFLDTIRTEA